MKQTNKNIAGNGLLVGLLIIALVGAAVAGWMYINKNGGMDALPDSADMTATTSPADTGDVMTDAQGNAVPSTVPPSTMPEAPAVDDSAIAPAPEQPAADATVTSDTTVTPDTSSVASVPAGTIDVDAAFGVRALGDPNAPVKMVEYSSLTCSHCAHFYNDTLPELKTKYIDTGKVYLEFRDFPTNDPALKATLTARCLPAEKYESFIALLFKTQDQWAAGINYMNTLKQNAKLAGMSDETFEACHANQDLKLKLAETMQAAQDKWKVSATPTFVVNEGAEVITGARPIEEFERVFRKVTNNAVGEAPAVQ